MAPFRRFVLIALSLMVLATTTRALHAQPVDSAIGAGNVDVTRSVVYAFVGKSGLGHEHAVAGKFKTGNIFLGKGADAGELTFEMKSFRADTQAARAFIGLEGTTPAGTQKQVNQSMLGMKVLHITQFPAAQFTIRSAAPIGQGSATGTGPYQLEGDFTLHGVTHAITIPITAEFKEGATHLQGKFSILQSEYGIKPFRKALGAIGVADEVTIHGDLWLTNKGDAPAVPVAR